MANLTETVTWEPGIYQIETTDLVLGGPAGVANLQPKQLANRTSWLKQQVESLGTANVDWSRIINKPTTLAGYGITDAVPASRTITANSPLTGGGDLSANRAIGIQDGTTAQKGAVQLYGGVDSASNTLAATAGALKAVNDSAGASIAAEASARANADNSIRGDMLYNPDACEVGGYTMAYALAELALETDWGNTQFMTEWRPAAGTYRIKKKVMVNTQLGLELYSYLLLRIS
jgi:hypothetical protein